MQMFSEDVHSYLAKICDNLNSEVCVCLNEIFGVINVRNG